MVAFLEVQIRCEYVAKVFMTTLGAAWSKKICIPSTNLFSKFLSLDLTNEDLYYTSDFSGEYMFICKLRVSDGVATKCTNYGGDSSESPYFMKIYGDYILTYGTSNSSAMINNSIYGTFAIWLHRDLDSKTFCH